MSSVLITGASGFIGNKLSTVLAESGIFVRGVVRNNNNNLTSLINETAYVNDINSNTNWGQFLQGIDVVIHLASRVHVMNEKEKDPLSVYREVNVNGTLNLARQASAAGIKRFIFISSVKVNGEYTILNHPFTENDLPEPVDPYAVSKFEAEQALYQLSENTGMEVVCIRPPLIYGEGVKANFLSMMKWLHKGIPLPFGAIYNQRSYLALDNLIDFIIICIKHPAAVNETFFISDGEDLSTTELLKRVLSAMGKHTWLLPVKHKLLEIIFILLGKKELAQRLFGSLQVDISKSKKLLNWSPPVSVDNALSQTVKYFLEHQA